MAGSPTAPTARRPMPLAEGQRSPHASAEFEYGDLDAFVAAHPDSGRVPPPTSRTTASRSFPTCATSRRSPRASSPARRGGAGAGGRAHGRGDRPRVGADPLAAAASDRGAQRRSRRARRRCTSAGRTTCCAGAAWCAATSTPRSPRRCSWSTPRCAPHTSSTPTSNPRRAGAQVTRHRRACHRFA